MTQVSMWIYIVDSVWEHLKESWPAVGPLAGILIGAYLTRSWDRRKWLSENRRDECRELLTALTNATAALIEESQTIVAFDSTDKMANREPYLLSLRTLQDRIFIAEDIAGIKLFDRWGESVKALLKTGNVHAFEDTFEEIRKEIVGIGTKV
jgi:hypothetical protein